MHDIIAAPYIRRGRGARRERDHARTEEREGGAPSHVDRGTRREEVEAAEEGLAARARRRADTKRGSEEVRGRDRSASVCEVRGDVASTWHGFVQDSAFSKGAISTCGLHVSAMSAPHHKRNFRSITPFEKALLNEVDLKIKWSTSKMKSTDIYSSQSNEYLSVDDEGQSIYSDDSDAEDLSDMES
ncbi:hypothetical protein Scep_012341 [Stephania cephalantha]|uniref:Uncharacterized protein n=1 Tax=Stephania cephalantha TaxID=152367 RepID=A0AAP0JGQ0_9MAGN